MERLDRIESLRGRGAPPGELLDEVRLLLAESEDWLRNEAAARDAKEVVDRVKNALVRGEQTVSGNEQSLSTASAATPV
jgi:hypothetical protein